MSNVQEPRQPGDLFPGDALGECRADADSLNPGSCETAAEDRSRGLNDATNDGERPDTRNIP